MAYIVIQDFRGGLDTRRMPEAAPAGTLQVAENVHVNRGGELEKRKALSSLYTLPAGTFGFEIAAGVLIVFGSADLAASVPSGVTYQRLQHPDSLAMTAMHGTTVFNGKVYAVAEFGSGNIAHFYDGEIVGAWINGVVRSSFGDNNGTATHIASVIDATDDYSATATGPNVTVTGPANGSAFNATFSTENVDGGTDDQNITLTSITTAIPEVAETLATATASVVNGTSGQVISNLTVNGVAIFNTSSSVNWTTNNAGTATTLKDAINNFTSTPDYNANSSGQTVTISASAGTGASANGQVVAATANMTVNTTNMTGGVSAVNGTAQQTRIEITGAHDVGDVFTINLGELTVCGGRVAGKQGKIVLTHQDKVHALDASEMYFSALGDPTKWNAEDTGAGFISMSTAAAGFEELTGVGTYQRNLAVFSRRATQIWSMDEDPGANAQLQVLPNFGTVAARSITSYGDSDVFFLADTGVRSLRPRDSSNQANVNDIGTPIDTLIVEAIRTLSADTVAAAVGAVEPVDGRYWLGLGTTLYVFTYFPTGKVSAWSTYSPGVTVTHIKTVGNKTYLRAANSIRLYGGTDGNTYDSSAVVIETPYMDGRQVSTWKEWSGIEVACEGTWSLSVNTDPRNPDVWEPVGIVTGTTFNELQGAINCQAPSLRLRLTHNEATAARLAMIVVHYQPTKET